MDHPGDHHLSDTLVLPVGENCVSSEPPFYFQRSELSEVGENREHPYRPTVDGHCQMVGGPIRVTRVDAPTGVRFGRAKHSMTTTLSLVGLGTVMMVSITLEQFRAHLSHGCTEHDENSNQSGHHPEQFNQSDLTEQSTLVECCKIVRVEPYRLEPSVITNNHMTVARGPSDKITWVERHRTPSSSEHGAWMPDHPDNTYCS